MVDHSSLPSCPEAQLGALPRRDVQPGDAVETALLDRAGVIVAVNQAWSDFSRDNGGDDRRTGVGNSYLAACEAAGDAAAAQVAAAIRSAIGGKLPAPMTLRIACDAPDQPRWFDVLISSRIDTDGACLGATVSLSRSEAKTATAELEQLLGQATDRAQDALDAQGRLHALLHANAVVASDLSLPVVLHRIVIAAQELVGAGYAALGVVGPDGALEQFVHVGMTAETVGRIGQLPRGQGILGLLIDDPQPLRLAELSTHLASVGFPPNHPPMGSFLGVPIRVREQIFGNLYLTESSRGEFDAEDEQLVTALAATAGVAIDNARLHERTERQRQWLAASTEVTRALFAGNSTQPLSLVLEHAARGAGADDACMMVPTSDGRIRVETGTGVVGEQLTGQVLDLDTTLTGRAIQTGKPVLSDEDDAQLDDLVHANLLTATAGRAVAVPLLADDDTVLGAILVSRRAVRARFTEADMTQLADFAGHAGVALALDSARADRDAARTLADHDRIAADLHDHVVQELFATGIGLEGMIHAVNGAQQERLMGYVESLDATIRRIRSTIFSLQHPANRAGTLLQQLFSVIDEERAALGFAAAVELNGTLDLSVPPALGDDLMAVVREALSNIARHAEASAARIRIALDGASLNVDIIDNGVGFGNPTRSSGLTNMRRRAHAHGGDLTISAPPDGGTRLHWTAHLGDGS